MKSKTKDNNHFLSEFQLRKFVCEPPQKKPGKYYVWVYQSDAPPRQENVGGVGSSYQFYGASDDTLENALGDAESKFGQIYKQIIIRPQEISKYGDQLSDLIWLFGFRTRAMRERIRNSLITVGEEFKKKGVSDDARGYLERKLEEKVDERIIAELAQLNGFQKLEKKNSGETVSLKNNCRRIIRTAVRSGAFDHIIAQITGFFRQFADVPGLLDDEHNVGIQEFLDSGGKCPELLKPKFWTAVLSTEGQFVLGDCGAFAVMPDRSIEPALGVGSSALEVYLPISAGIVAVGSFILSSPSLNEVEIIRGAISTSYESFFASRFSTDLENMALNLLGSRKGLVSNRELEDIVNNLFK
jgi:hypothetical protein